jgi:hypothetical protein
MPITTVPGWISITSVEGAEVAPASDFAPPPPEIRAVIAANCFGLIPTSGP